MSIRSLVALSLLHTSLLGQGGLWGQLSPPSSPTPRYGASLVYDSARDRLVLVGGAAGVSTSITETWEFDGSQWLLRGNFGPTGIPTNGQSMRAVYDSQRQRTVAVRGDGPSNLTTTFEWNGTTWQQRSSTVSPPGRFDFALAYDSARGRTVLFGGSSGLFGPMSDTWEWDGTNWVQRGTGGPPGRTRHAMAFDAARGRTVLFGGSRHDSYPQQFGDTWEWNGTSWIEFFGVPGPNPRSEHSMTYDAVRQRTILVGGQRVIGGGTTYLDTWEWNGVAWSNMSAVAPASQYPGLAYDAARQRTVLFGGRTFGNVLGETWAYGAPGGPAASIVPYGAGCAGPNGVPSLAAQAGSVPRLGSTLTMVVSGMPSGLLDVPIGWIGFDAATWGGLPLPLPLDALGFPGCQALLAPSQTYTLVNVAGVATWSIAIPFLPAFSGLQFYAQAGVTVIGFNPGGLVFTGGLQATVGT